MCLQCTKIFRKRNGKNQAEGDKEGNGWSAKIDSFSILFFRPQCKSKNGMCAHNVITERQLSVSESQLEFHAKWRYSEPRGPTTLIVPLPLLLSES